VLLEGKVGIVSGVGPNIGRSIALALAREGADLALAARREDVLHDVRAEVEALGRRAACIPTDITDAAQCRRLAAQTHEQFGRIDVLVNNAFLAAPVERFETSNVDDWRQAMEVNYWGSLYMTHAVVPYMREAGGGCVIMINAGRDSSTPGFAPYIGSKAALRATSRVLAQELGASGIRVNSVVPNYTGEADDLRRRFAAAADARGVDVQVVLDEIEQRNALGFIPTPDDVAKAVLFFASDLSNAATGQYLFVDGGFLYG
jgi:NAD(P)-dependent dehydrogenase (short-subunit alcohol dehydrogenase family)